MQDVKWSERPPRRWYFAALAVVTLISLYGASGPVWNFQLVLLMLPAWMVLGLHWLVRTAVAVGSMGRAAARRQWLRWMSAPLVVLGLVVVLAVDGPMWVRFTLSEPSMQAYAKTIAAGNEIDRSCRWLGLYHVCWGEPVEGGALLVVGDIPSIQTMGFAWLPGGQEPSDAGYENYYTPFTGTWWDWQGWDSL
ncbi:hypothetical protein [Streptosporangium sp. 'caverna']|uniref:hypothetical protein n=1 Tax=Streptosporangium sp. 'caverna' TaxID=2202249 RepID=UPI000D7E06A0|nr:hypothetical protein [Streptosporangium sp. 'caverna']AWS40095.1 hypothetical protein DKM19_00875 [Streptosporangium sp. 'caverna']